MEPDGEHARERAEAAEHRAEHCEGPLEAARALAEAGEFREAMGDLERASRHFLRALELDARQAIAKAGFLRLSAELRDVHRHVEALERWAARLEEGAASASERGDAEIVLARAWTSVPGRLDRSFEHYRNAVALDPELEGVLDEAVDKAKKARRIQDVRSLLALAASCTRVPERKVAVLRELAEARRALPADLDGVIEALSSAAALVPADRPLREELCAALAQRAQRRKGTDAARADLDALVELHVELARLSPPDGALVEVERALDLRPTHAVALALLASLVTEGAPEARLVARLEAAIRTPADANAARAARRELAALHARAGRDEAAYLALEPLLAGMPEADVVAQALELARSAGRLRDVVALIPRVYEPHAGERALVAYAELMQLALARGELTVAEDCARHVLERAPANDAALVVLAEVHTRRDEPAETRKVLERRLSLANDGATRRTLLRAIVALCDGPLADTVAATDAFKTLAELDPRDADLRAELLARLASLGRHRAIAEVRVWELTHLESQRDRKAALDALLALQRATPVEPALVVAALRTYRAGDPTDPEARDALVRFLRDAGELPEAASLLRESVRAASDAGVRLAKLDELAELLELGLRDDEGAREACLALLELSPDRASAVERLERMAARGGRRDRLVESLVHRARTVEGADRLAVLVRLGRLHEQAPVDTDAAIGVWQAARAIDASHAEAEQALLRLYAATGRHVDQALLLEDLARTESDVEARAGYLRTRAHLLRDVLGDAHEAAACFRAIRTLRDDEESLLALIDHARAAELHSELSYLLATRLGAAADAAEAVELGMERATLLLDHLGDPREAERELLEVRRIDPSFTPALARLAGIYDDEGDGFRLAEVLEAHLAATTQPAQRATLAARLFGLYEKVTPDFARALDAARAWAAAAPVDLDAQRALAERLDPESHADELVRALDARADELLRRIARAEDGPSRAEHEEAFGALADSVRTTVVHRSDPAHAEKRFARLLELAHADPEDVTAAIRLATELDAHAGDDRLRRLAATFLARKATMVARPIKERLFLVAADLFGGSLADVPRAFEVLRRAITECPDDPTILQSLVEYGTAGGLEEPLGAVLAECFDASIDARTARALKRAHADVLYSLGQYTEAADAYHRLVAMEPDDEKARARHRECLARADRHQDLIIALDQAVRRLGGETGPRRVALLRDLARTWDYGLEKRFEAVDAWKSVLAVAPDDTEATDALARLAAKATGDEAAARSRSMPPRLASSASIPPPPPAVRPPRTSVPPPPSPVSASTSSIPPPAPVPSDEIE